jgi:uncharacterized membrane protein
MAAASALVLAAPASAHGLHTHAAGALHAVFHAVPVLAVVVGVVVAYRVIRSRLPG